MKRTLATLVAVVIVGGTLSIASVAGAQDQANPWFVDRFEPVGSAEITEVRTNGRVAFEIPTARVYGDASHDFWVLAGIDLMDVCLGNTEPAETLITYRENGRFVLRSPAGGIDVSTYVYPRTGDDVFAWFGEVCEGWAVDRTPLPAPVASGIATLRILSNPDVPTWSTEFQPGGVFRNGVEGTLADADGNLWNVSTRVVFPFDPERQGPPEFVTHDVSLTPAS